MMLWAVIGAKDELYPRYRDEFLRGDRLALPYLVRTANSRGPWQERVMAGILLERLTKSRQVEMLVQAWGSVPVPRGYSAQHVELGSALAKHAAQTPMFLVEKVWKDNELRNRGVPPEEDAAWAAQALGHLGEERALFPLISLLRGEYYKNEEIMRPVLAAEALGRLGDARAVPSLCRASVLYGNERDVVNATFMAIRQCGDQDSASIMWEYATFLEAGPAKSRLETLCRMLRGVETP